MDEILETDYQWIFVETYYESGSGLHGDVHVRPLPGQEPFKNWYRVECSKKMRDPVINPVPTKFKIWAKVTNRRGTPLIYTNPSWPYTVIKD